MKNSAASISTAHAVVSTVSAAKGYWIERRYEGNRTAAQVVSALMQAHDRVEKV